MGDVATGLGAIGFWLFLAAIIVAGIWNDIRNKESQQETLRRIVESGRDLDPATIDRLIGIGGDPGKQARDLKIASLITLGVAVGMFLFGVALGMFDSKARIAMFGIALLIGCIGGGLHLAYKFVERKTARA